MSYIAVFIFGMAVMAAIRLLFRDSKEQQITWLLYTMARIKKCCDAREPNIEEIKNMASQALAEQ